MKNKIAIYTSIFGPYDGLLPQPKLSNVDYICFTDQPFKSKTWKIVPSARKFEDATRDSRMRKILPHRFLPDYDCSIYMDGNFMVRKNSKLANPGWFFDSELDSNYPMVVFSHNQCEGEGTQRNCIYEEYRGLIHNSKRYGRDKDIPSVMKAQVDSYREEGYPENNGLVISGVLVRKHNHEKVKSLMEGWWKEVSNGSKRDQLSFNYVAWKQSFPITYLKGDVRNNEFFRMIGVHRKSYKGKYFRYRLKRFLGLID